MTALLGLAWNLGALVSVAWQSLAAGRGTPSLLLLPLVNAAVFTALGFLPARRSS